ncbi:MAG: hypothetical protein RTU30_10710 [Candidatus Thorarchaeota archaeon]
MQRLLDSEESIRREAAASLDEQASKTPQELVPLIPELLGYLSKSSDEIVSLGISSAIMKTCESISNAGRKYSTEILGALEDMSYLEMTDDDKDSIINATTTHLFNTQIPHLLTNPQLLTATLPLVFKYLRKTGAVRWSAYRLVAQTSNENPRLLENYIGDIINLVGQGNKELSASLLTLYQVKPEEFEKHLDVIIHVYQTDQDVKTIMSSILLEVSKKRPELIEPHVQLLVAGLSSPTMASVVSMILSEVARAKPESVYPYIKDVRQSMDFVDSLKYTIPNLFGLIGRLSEDTAREVLPFLAEMLEIADQNAATMILSEFRNLGDMNRELLVPYMDLIRRFVDDPQEYVRAQANLIIDYMEGRDLRSLAMQIAEQNAMISEAAVSVDALKEYVDKNVEMLKTFIADVVKRLPTPVKFSIEGRVRKTMQLHFVCSQQSEHCIYPVGRPFITETKAWNKWLKLAVSVVKLGKAVIFPTETGEAIEAVKEAYESYKAGDDKEFLAFISEPFLTSEEQDNLVNQLRDERFFEVFDYDPQTAGWACMMCKPKVT